MEEALDLRSSLVGILLLVSVIGAIGVASAARRNLLRP